MATAVVTDSNSGIFGEEAARLGVWSVPMPIILDNKIYYEGVDITHDEFFSALEQGKIASSSQPTPHDIKTLWDEVLAQGYDDLVYIPMSSALSMSCATAKLLSADYEGRVRVSDNRRISILQRQSVYDALTLAKAGWNADHIAVELERRSEENSIYLSVDTLTYLQKGGRVSATTAVLGNMLNIKPIMSIQCGKLEPVAKAHGMNKAMKQMYKLLDKDLKKRLEGEDRKVDLYVAGTGLTKEFEDEMVEQVRKQYPDYKVSYDRLPLSIAVHTGPGALGVGAAIIVTDEDAAK